MTVLLVALGAAAGTALRYWAAAVVGGRPATLAVNVAGSLLLGLLVEGPVAALAVGFAGGLTTFSTWAVETADGGGWRYAVTTAALCLAAAAVGLALARAVAG